MEASAHLHCTQLSGPSHSTGSSAAGGCCAAPKLDMDANAVIDRVFQDLQITPLLLGLLGAKRNGAIARLHSTSLETKGRGRGPMRVSRLYNRAVSSAAKVTSSTATVHPPCQIQLSAAAHWLLCPRQGWEQGWAWGWGKGWGLGWARGGCCSTRRPCPTPSRLLPAPAAARPPILLLSSSAYPLSAPRPRRLRRGERGG